MQKDYEKWHRLKEAIHNADESSRLGYRPREVWWVRLGHNVGDEEDGKGIEFTRPVLVVRGFNRHIFWGVPLTSIGKQGQYYYPFRVKGSSKTSTAMLSQLRVFDTKRLASKMGIIDIADLDEIKKKLSELLS